ncbi:hypothetical protein GCM10009416_10860 [Craurococcus roseus]|uniref:Uncharacterized protein n=1 Tax=Craurococcus roseus TaxID=77585 RepID=A0ABP3PS22_9PROT
MRASAVSTTARATALPWVPTAAKAASCDLVSWRCLLAPAGTDAALVARLNPQANRALADSVLRNGCRREGSGRRAARRRTWSGCCAPTWRAGRRGEGVTRPTPPVAALQGGRRLQSGRGLLMCAPISAAPLF